MLTPRAIYRLISKPGTTLSLLMCVAIHPATACNQNFVVLPKELPGLFLMIGHEYLADKPVSGHNWVCNIDSCSIADKAGVGVAGALDDMHRLEVFVAAVDKVKIFTGDLPFGLTAGEDMWAVVKRLDAIDAFPSLTIFSRETGEIILTTGNCLEFPSGASGALRLWFSRFGEFSRLQLTIPSESE